MRIAFENLRHGIRNLLEDIHLRRNGLQRPPEDLLDTPGHDQIEFVTLSPNSDSPDHLHSFAQLTEGWVRKNCDSFIFSQAESLVREYRVLLKEQLRNRLLATIEDDLSYPVEVLLTPDGLFANCICPRSQQSLTAAVQRVDWLRCEHIVAPLLYVLEERTKADAAADAPTLCPITRQSLTADRPIYHCTKCQTCYSQEGWELLRTEDRGRCCHCHSKKTIQLFRPGG